jgi:D-alanine-D-alanine ligase
MKVAIVYSTPDPGESDVINVFGLQTKERYDPKMVALVASALEQGGHEVRAIRGNMSIIDELRAFMPRVARGEGQGMVFNMAYGVQGRSRYTHVPALLEMLGLPYVGSGPCAHAVALNKVLSKVVLLHHNLPTPEFWVVVDPGQPLDGIRYPAIAKPEMEAASFGVQLVEDEAELRQAVAAITREYEQAVLVEEFIPGREFAVSLLGNGPTLDTLPIVEIDLGGDPSAYQSYQLKMVVHPRKLCPAEVAPETEAELKRLSRCTFNALGISDFARVDFRMDPAGKLHVLELNSMASLNLTGSFVKSAEVAGLDFAALVNRMLDVAVARYPASAFPRS